MPFGGLLTVGLISAGTQIYAVHKASSAAKDAAKTQANAANTARSDVRETMNPYLTVGNQAVTALGSAMGFPTSPVGGAAPMAQPGQPTMTMAQRYQSLGMAQPQAGTQGAAPPGYFGDYRSQHAPTSDPQATAMQTQSSYSGQNGAPKMVPMRAPTGETQLVPEDHVAHFEQAGATRVS